MAATTYNIEVVTHSIHIRSQPVYKKDASNVVGYAHINDTFTASKEQNGWYYIDSKKGWMKAKGSDGKTYLKVTKKPAESKGVTASTPAKPTGESTKVTATTTVDNVVVAKKVSTDPITTKTETYINPNLGNLKNVVLKKNSSSGVTNHVTELMDTAKIYSLNNYKMSDNKIPKDFKLDYTEFEKSFAAIRKNHNIMIHSDRLRLFRQFNRFKLPVADFALNKTVPYVFFTRPNLDLVSSNGLTLNVTDNLFTSIHNNQPRIIQSLDANYMDGHSFNPLLSNAAMSFQTSDEVLKTVDHGETYTGWKMVYGRHYNESNTSGQFSIQYTDSYNYDIYKMHKVWIDYISKVYRGEIPVKRKHIWEKVLTYPCAVYYIVCAADGETILYWTKYYGVFPINTPASASSFTHGSTSGFPEFSINYVYSIKEDFNPISLREFNFLSSGDSIYRESYNPNITGPTNTFVGTPYIDDVQQTIDGHTHIVHKLRFRN